MARVEVLLPRMGESITEATLLQWTKNVGDRIEYDETIAEIATDKVDSEVPSPVSGVIKELLYEPNDIIQVGKPMAVIDSEGAETFEEPIHEENGIHQEATPTSEAEVLNPPFVPTSTDSTFHSEIKTEPSDSDDSTTLQTRYDDGSFYSPLVRSIAEKEGLTSSELKSIPGTGKDGKVTKDDVLGFVDGKKGTSGNSAVSPSSVPLPDTNKSHSTPIVSNTDRVEEMDRMRQLIASNMLQSKQISAHVTSFAEADLTTLVQWRERNKDKFYAQYGFKITFMPFIIEAVVKAIRQYPRINSQVEGNNIIYKGQINIGMATALPDGNLIVPVIKNADSKNLFGLSKEVNDLATKARDNALLPDDVKDGTFTITNLGQMGNLTGTPIILQPQVAILAVGTITKQPSVLETPSGDVIAIRHKMILSMSYDHRIIDGYMGGSFLQLVCQNLENIPDLQDL